MSDIEKKELSKQVFQLARKLGKIPSSREVRKYVCSYDKFHRIFGSFNDLLKFTVKEYPELDDFIMPARLTTNDLENFRLQFEKSKIQNKNKEIIRKAAVYDYLEFFSDRVFSGKVAPYHPPKSKGDIKRALILNLSDLHIGGNIRADETGFLNYGKVEEARRLAEVIRQTINFKVQYRDETELHVNLMGDIIKHKLHDREDAAAMAEQKCRAIHLLIQAVSQLAENFHKVYVRCTPGNHGRDTGRHPSRATSGKWDSEETVIYYAVKSALKKYPNVVFDIPKTPFVTYEVMGHKAFVTHGDTVFNLGSPGKVINIKNLSTQINELNSALPDAEKFVLVFGGHTHVANVTKLNYGANLIMNGALEPVDQFCTSIGIFKGRSSQTLIECTKEHALGDIRMIEVGYEQDTNKDLDKIIVPWEDF